MTELQFSQYVKEFVSRTAEERKSIGADIHRVSNVAHQRGQSVVKTGSYFHHTDVPGVSDIDLKIRSNDAFTHKDRKEWVKDLKNEFGQDKVSVSKKKVIQVLGESGEKIDVAPLKAAYNPAKSWNSEMPTRMFKNNQPAQEASRMLRQTTKHTGTDIRNTVERIQNENPGLTSADIVKKSRGELGLEPLLPGFGGSQRFRMILFQVIRYTAMSAVVLSALSAVVFAVDSTLRSVGINATQVGEEIHAVGDKAIQGAKEKGKWARTQVENFNATDAKEKMCEAASQTGKAVENKLGEA
eukprot:gene804-180_t